jgi:hypothetical protein
MRSIQVPHTALVWVQSGMHLYLCAHVQHMHAYRCVGGEGVAEATFRVNSTAASGPVASVGL